MIFGPIIEGGRGALKIISHQIRTYPGAWKMENFQGSQEASGHAQYRPQQLQILARKLASILIMSVRPREANFRCENGRSDWRNFHLHIKYSSSHSHFRVILTSLQPQNSRLSSPKLEMRDQSRSWDDWPPEVELAEMNHLLIMKWRYGDLRDDEFKFISTLQINVTSHNLSRLRDTTEVWSRWLRDERYKDVDKSD